MLGWGRSVGQGRFLPFPVAPTLDGGSVVRVGWQGAVPTGAPISVLSQPSGKGVQRSLAHRPGRCSPVVQAATSVRGSWPMCKWRLWLPMVGPSWTVLLSVLCQEVRGGVSGASWAPGAGQWLTQRPGRSGLGPSRAGPA